MDGRVTADHTFVYPDGTGDRYPAGVDVACARCGQDTFAHTTFPCTPRGITDAIDSEACRRVWGSVVQEE